MDLSFSIFLFEVLCGALAWDFWLYFVFATPLSLSDYNGVEYLEKSANLYKLQKLAVKNMIFNSFVIGIRFIFCTIIIAAIHFIVFFIAIRLFTPLIFLGMGLTSFLSSYFLKNVLFYIEESQNKRAI